MDKYSFPYSGQIGMDRPELVYKMCLPKINKETDQKNGYHLSQMRLKLSNLLYPAKTL